MVTRRLRLPSLFWQAVSLVKIVALFANDPKLEILWSAKAACVYPQNTSTDTVRITTLERDFDGRVTRANTPEGVINYDWATGLLTNVCTTNSQVAYHHDILGRLDTVTALKRNCNDSQGFYCNHCEESKKHYAVVAARPLASKIPLRKQMFSKLS